MAQEDTGDFGLVVPEGWLASAVLTGLAHRGRTLLGTDEALALRGKAALANARLAYEAYENVFAGDRFTALAGARANPQRLTTVPHPL